MSPWTEQILEQLANAGLAQGTLLSTDWQSEPIESAQFLYRLGHLYIRIDLDRGQKLVYLGPSSDLDRVFPIDDIGADFGWWTVAEANAEAEPASLALAFERIAASLPQLQKQFTPTALAATEKRLRALAKQRVKLRYR